MAPWGFSCAPVFRDGCSTKCPFGFDEGGLSESAVTSPTLNRARRARGHLSASDAARERDDRRSP